MYRGNLIKHYYEHHSLTSAVRKSSQLLRLVLLLNNNGNVNRTLHFVNNAVHEDVYNIFERGTNG
jgi:hypothetical protein